jgi:hypothetical protein
MYKLLSKNWDGSEPKNVLRISDGTFIPFDPANTDYQKFKQDVLEGAELQDADGNVMTQEEAVAFISELS